MQNYQLCRVPTTNSNTWMGHGFRHKTQVRANGDVGQDYCLRQITPTARGQDLILAATT